jgi:hypothetical protein
MCYPAVALAALGAGSIISGVGRYVGAQGEAAAANYQGAVAQNNARISEQNAKYAEQVGEVNVQTSRIRTAGTIGSERAAYAASGVDTSKGTSARVQSDTADLGELDVATIRNNAARQAYGYRVQAMNYTAEAALDSQRARYAHLAGNIGLMGSLISGAGQVAGARAGFMQVGAS